MRVPQQLFTGVRRDRDHAGGARERSLSRCGIGEVVTRFDGTDQQVGALR